jgi:hypothetical protein
MNKTGSGMTVSPRVGVLLTQVAETADLDTALLKVLSEYIELKVNLLQDRIQAFESKWGMTFEEFSLRCEKGTLDRDAFGYEVESDFWEWEKAGTLLQHYETLQAQWM